MQSHHEITDEDEEQCLYHADDGHIDDLRTDIAGIRELQELLALQQCPVLDDLLCATTHTQEGSHDDGHEEVAHQILVVHHGIAFWWRIARQQCTDECQQGCLQQRDAEILYIGDLGADITVQEDTQLLQSTGLLLV